MRSLTLLRHAKSVWDDPSVSDYYRPLNQRGRNAARAMGSYLARKDAVFDLILASPAERVAETLKNLVKGGWKSGPVQFHEAIYGAGCDEVLAMIQSVPEHVGRLMVVGHNPALAQLAVRLTRDDEHGLRAQASVKYPTCALAEIAFEAGSWAEVGVQGGVLVDFQVPASLPDA